MLLGGDWRAFGQNGGLAQFLERWKKQGYGVSLMLFSLWRGQLLNVKKREERMIFLNGTPCSDGVLWERGLAGGHGGPSLSLGLEKRSLLFGWRILGVTASESNGGGVLGGGRGEGGQEDASLVGSKRRFPENFGKHVGGGSWVSGGGHQERKYCANSFMGGSNRGGDVFEHLYRGDFVPLGLDGTISGSRFGD